MKAFFVLLFLLPMVALADVGFAPLGITSPRFPCTKLLHLYKTPQYKTLAFLPLSFGNSTKCLTKLHNKTGALDMYLYLSNESCRRFNRCDSTELLPGLSTFMYKRRLRLRPDKLRKPIQNRLTKLLDTYSGFGSVTIVTGLEDDLNAVERANLISIIREVYDGPLQQNPSNPDTFIHGIALEYHRLQHHKPNRFTPGTIFINDGWSICDAGQRCPDYYVPMSTLCQSFRQSRASTKLIWIAVLNGTRFQNGRFIKPISRRFRFLAEDVSQLRELVRCASQP